MLSVASLLVLFPELTPAGTTLLTAHIARAEQLVGDTWGDKREYIVALQTATLVANSPQGRNARLADANGVSTYSKELKDLQEQHCAALNRVG